MTKSNDLECHGCKISMFCQGKDKEVGQPCETNLKAVLVAFVVPLVCMVLLLVVAKGRVGEGWAALAILVFLVLYFLVIKLLKPNFGKTSTKK